MKTGESQYIVQMQERAFLTIDGSSAKGGAQKREENSSSITLSNSGQTVKCSLKKANLLTFCIIDAKLKLAERAVAAA